jgi:hypothetical protein
MVRSTTKNSLPVSRAIDHLSPLPTEILAKLFELVAQDGPLILHLTHVSRRFRAIAVHTPTLWVNICISEWAIRSKELLAMYLTRSQELLLNITLSFSLSFSSKRSHYYNDHESDSDWGSDDEDITMFRALLKCLIPHVSRWHRLSILSNTFNVRFGTAMKFLEHLRVPHLESFEIDHTGIGMHVGYPPLKSVKCLNIDICYSGRSSDASDLQIILAQCSSLTRLLIKGFFYFDDERPVQMRHLISLEITSEAETIDILSLIKAPNLENLTVGVPYKPGSLIKGIRAKPLSQQFPGLKRLELDMSNVERGQFRRLHDAFPNVTHIRVHPLAGDLSIWKFLDASRGHVYWPKLQGVTHLSKSVERQWDIIPTAISSRAAMGLPISELCVHTSYLEGLADRCKWLPQQVAIEIL